MSKQNLPKDVKLYTPLDLNANRVNITCSSVDLSKLENLSKPILK